MKVALRCHPSSPFSCHPSSSFSCHSSVSFSCHPSFLFLSFQRSLSCHPSSSVFVIPVLDTGIQLSIKMVHFNITFMFTYLIKFLDSSVTRWNDTTCCKNKCSFIDCS
ncbi:primosomal protein N [Wolbachia endosymbiont of Cimex lectularius]|nr:primosomal protein N [Wolbachia endosymbiont of Cimex lectularius]